MAPAGCGRTVSNTSMRTFLVIACCVAGSVQTEADRVVSRLRALPAALPPSPRSDGRPVPEEELRIDLYEELRQLGPKALPALKKGLRHPDVQLRRNVALALSVLSGSWYSRSKTPMDISPLLPALVEALKDQDARARALSAAAIGNIGPSAVSAVPALITLLGNRDEGSRNNACIALRGIGPAAKDALPALRRALSDPSKDVRGFAERAIVAIQARL